MREGGRRGVKAHGLSYAACMKKGRDMMFIGLWGERGEWGGRGIEKEKASEGETKIAIGEQAKVAISCCYSKN